MERQKLEECIMDFLSSNDGNVYGDINLQIFNQEVGVESIWYSGPEDKFYLHVCSPEFEGDLDVHSLSDENQEKLFRVMKQKNHEKLFRVMKQKNHENEERTIWLRLGVTVKSSKEDIENLIQVKDSRLADETLERLFKEGKVVMDGDWYIPDVCVQTYDEEYGTNFSAN